MTRIVYATLYETSLPMLLLNEEWIKEAGFKIGESLVVRIEPKKLIITPDQIDPGTDIHPKRNAGAGRR